MVCSAGTYSLSETSSECQSCIDLVTCEGGSSLNVDSGYWRSSYYSLQIHPCLDQDACIGGVIQNSSSSSDELCLPGYGGNLCDSCVVY